MNLRLDAIGTALPAFSIPQELSARWSQEVSGANGRRKLIPAVFKSTGIRNRHSVLLEGDPLRQTFFKPAPGRGPTTRERMDLYARDAGPLALRSARAAIGDGQRITHLVTVSCSGFGAPGFDLELILGLDLDPTVARTHIGFMGCHGALNGLRVAHAFAGADPDARVLLCAVELCSIHYDYGSEARRILANALFADGAAAVVARAGEGPWSLAASGSCVLPDSADLMTWSIGDHGFEMGLSGRVPEVIARHLRPWLASWLDRCGLGMDEVASWAVHPGGPRIVGAVEEALGLPPGATADSRALLEECGNMSSPTILFILDRMRRRAAPLPCVALAFGPGLAVEAALFT